MSNSGIFDLTDKFGYQSPWNDDWLRNDFPGIRNQRNYNINQQLTATPDIRLECDKLKYLPINTDYILRLVSEGPADLRPTEQFEVELSCSNPAITLSTKKFTTSKGTTLLTTINSTATGSAAVDIDVAGMKKNTINIEFLDSKDVFPKTDIDRQIAEFQYISPYADAGTAPEYDENYCMQAAERGLSELLNNTTDFYSVNRTSHTHKNSIGFSGKTAYTRGDKFNTEGFVEHMHIIPHSWYTIDHVKRKQINDSADATAAQANYAAVHMDIVTLSVARQTQIMELFKTDIETREIGYHVYYMTVTKGFHTLTLIINNTDPCNPTYEIWDQHGLTSSSGTLANIADGLRRQTSWTFANTCLNRYNKGTTAQFDSTENKLWKIKRK
jgi:hypothetical protein